MIYGLYELGWAVEPWRVPLFLLMLLSGAGLAYGFLLLLTSASVWFMRNQSLFEMWWLFTTLMRYPSEIFKGPWASPIGWFFSFIVPIMLVTNVPARLMVKAFEPMVVAYALVATAVALVGSRWFFRMALRRYRSASS
jgi:ABC-2 type transport system permease protein